MKLWTVWVQADDGMTWLEAAWDDESTAENHSGWEEAVDKAGKVAKQNHGSMRVLAVDFPDAAVYDMFISPTVQATGTEPVA